MPCPFDWLEEISHHYAVILCGPNVCGGEWECDVSTVRGSPVSPIHDDVASGRGPTAATAIEGAMAELDALGAGEFDDLSTKEFLNDGD